MAAGGWRAYPLRLAGSGYTKAYTIYESVCEWRESATKGGKPFFSFLRKQAGRISVRSGLGVVATPDLTGKTMGLAARAVAT